ncbi:hypothetical protein NXY56_006608 [Leishmania guyanensis]
MLPSGFPTVGGRSLVSNSVAMHANPIHFTTPPRRHIASLSANVELTGLTAGVSLAHKELSACNVTGRVFNCTSMDGTPRCKSSVSITAVAALSTDVSPRQHRCGPSFTSGIMTESDSPCRSPRVCLTQTPTTRKLFTKPIPYGSLPSSGALLCKVPDGSLANRSSSGICGMSPSFSVTLSEAEEDTTLMSAESVFASASVDQRVPLRSASFAVNETRPPSSPSFTYFPSSHGGVAHESSASASDKANAAGAAPVACFYNAHSVCDGRAPSVKGSSATEHKFFEPLRFDTSGRLFSPLQRFSSVQSSQHANVAVDLESHILDCGIASVDHENLSAACPLSNMWQGRLSAIVKQQQLLHACLVSIARERTERPDSQRSVIATPKCAQQQRRRGSRLQFLMWQLCILLLRLTLRIMERVLAASAGKLRKLLCLPQQR